MGLPIVKIWRALKSNPGLRRKEIKMWMFLILSVNMIICYLVCMLSATETKRYMYASIVRGLLTCACNLMIVQNCYKFIHLANGEDRRKTRVYDSKSSASFNDSVRSTD